MEKIKTFSGTLFSPELISEVSNLFIKLVQTTDKNFEHENPSYHLNIKLNNEEWSYDGLEEFLAAYRIHRNDAYFLVYFNRFKSMSISTYDIDTRASVSGNDREFIEKLFSEFEKHVNSSKIPERRGVRPRVEKPTIFIGHGQNILWRDLKDHLQDKHGYKIEAYEIGARAGHGIGEILKEMMEKSSMAFLVMTGEDSAHNGSLRARQNVVHEIGLFQGRLGVSKAIVLLEEGTEEFSNLDGTQQIRFSKGNIREALGDVLSTIKREFP